MDENSAAMSSGEYGSANSSGSQQQQQQEQQQRLSRSISNSSTQQQQHSSTVAGGAVGGGGGSPAGPTSAANTPSSSSSAGAGGGTGSASSSQAPAGGSLVSSGSRFDSEDAFFEKNMAEVCAKYVMLPYDNWGKIICMEKNVRVTKYYMNMPVVTIDGSTEMTAERLGLGKFSSAQVDSRVWNIKKQIKQGVRLKLEQDGSILAKCVSDITVYAKTSYNKLLCVLPPNKAIRLFDMNKFKSSVEQCTRAVESGGGSQVMPGTSPDMESPLRHHHLSSAPDSGSKVDVAALHRMCSVVLSFMDNSSSLLATPVWLVVVNMTAVDILHEMGLLSIPAANTAIIGNNFPFVVSQGPYEVMCTFKGHCGQVTKKVRTSGGAAAGLAAVAAGGSSGKGRHQQLQGGDHLMHTFASGGPRLEVPQAPRQHRSNSWSVGPEEEELGGGGGGPQYSSTEWMPTSAGGGARLPHGASFHGLSQQQPPPAHTPQNPSHQMLPPSVLFRHPNSLCPSPFSPIGRHSGQLPLVSGSGYRSGGASGGSPMGDPALSPIARPSPIGMMPPQPPQRDFLHQQLQQSQQFQQQATTHEATVNLSGASCSGSSNNQAAQMFMGGGGTTPPSVSLPDTGGVSGPAVTAPTVSFYTTSADGEGARGGAGVRSVADRKPTPYYAPDFAEQFKMRFHRQKNDSMCLEEPADMSGAGLSTTPTHVDTGRDLPPKTLFSPGGPMSGQHTSQKMMEAETSTLQRSDN